jgi:Phage terminase-like protein, large subunit
MRWEPMSAPPRYATTRDVSRPTIGPATARIAALLGYNLLPWQRLVADVAGEVDPATGRMAYEMVLVTVPRQSGKSTLVRALGVQAALAEGGRAWYSAQTRNDARDGWMDAVEAVTRSPLAPAVQVRLTNGSEALRVSSTGGTFRVFAPTPGGLARPPGGPRVLRRDLGPRRPAVARSRVRRRAGS